MKLAALIFLLSISFATAARDYKLYCVLLEDTRVELSDGAVWMMDKGDVFPIISYKDQQKNVLLQLAGANFLTETVKIRVLSPEEVPAGLEVYRRNVRAYLESTSKKIQQRLQGVQGSKEKKKQ
jgi:hypothetical protein